jgi:hypothetical protein
MNRSTWTAVFWTVVVLVAATLSTYLPWRQMTPTVTRQASLAWGERTVRARDWLDERCLVLALLVPDRLRLRARPGPAVAALALAALAACGAGAALAVRARRRRPRVLRLAVHGESPVDIARRTGLPQDAVRLMLSPMLRSPRPGAGRGNSFRKRAAITAGPSRGPRGRTSAT